jgi:head-tail adaptor
VYLKVAGELEAMLRQLPPEIARKVVDRAVLEGTRVIAREMKMLAPVDGKAHESVGPMRELAPKRMRARETDRRISVYTVSETQGESGAWIPTETVLATVTAEILPGHEFAGSEGERDHVRPEKVFRIRWRSDITKKHLLRFASVDYDIVRIDEVGRRQGLDITVIARLPDQRGVRIVQSVGDMSGRPAHV